MAAVVVDDSSGTCTPGCSGDDALPAVFPSIVGGYNMPGIMLPQIMEETVEVAKLVPQERVPQRTLEETVNVLVLQIEEPIVAGLGSPVSAFIS